MNGINKEKLCGAFVKNTNQQCKKKPLPFANYCWWHYPKKALIVEFFIVFILTLTLSDPSIHFLSKIPIFYYLDKNKPLVEKIIPAIDKSSLVDKTTKYFKISCEDKDSELNLDKSYLKISRKENQAYIPISGKLDKTNFSFNFSLEKELKYGEYLLEVLLVDKADNENEFRVPFVVREKDELAFSTSYRKFEDSSVDDRKLFSDFFESKKGLVEHFEFYICKLDIRNKDSIAILRDIYLTINDDSGGIFFEWEQVGNLNTKGLEVYGDFAESFDKRRKGRIYGGQNLKIDEIVQRGFLILYYLIGKDKSFLKSQDEKNTEIVGIMKNQIDLMSDTLKTMLTPENFIKSAIQIKKLKINIKKNIKIYIDVINKKTFICYDCSIEIFQSESKKYIAEK